ncbi:hypothetical protein CBL_01414 [Carabus blaptoides fortunei]
MDDPFRGHWLHPAVHGPRGFMEKIPGAMHTNLDKGNPYSTTQKTSSCTSQKASVFFISRHHTGFSSIYMDWFGPIRRYIDLLVETCPLGCKEDLEYPPLHSRLYKS